MKLLIVDRFEEVHAYMPIHIDTGQDQDWPKIARWVPPHLPVPVEPMPEGIDGRQ